MEAYLAVRPAMTMLSVADASLGSPLAADVGGCGSRELPSRSGRVEPDDAPPPPASTASLESSALLGALACGLPDVFLSEVLTRLGAHDRAMLARACRGARACVLASGLPRAGVPPPRDDDENEAETTRVHHHPHPPFSASHFTRTLRLTRWGLANGMPLHWRTAEHAAAHGSVDVMRCLRSAESTPPCPWNWRACAKAAERGHLTLLRWLREGGCGFPWDVACAFAALGGHRDVLEWAHDRAGCPWDEETCAAAAEGGHLEVLKWLRARACPWDGETVKAAETRGFRRVAEWARAAGCPGG